MPEEPRLYSVEEANRYVPKLAAIVIELRRLRDSVTKDKDLHDVEEIASHGTTGAAAQAARDTMDQLQKNIRRVERLFEKELKFFEETGCELKGIDPGLVDFYSDRDGELVYLCWMENETSIRFWHPLGGGYEGRHPIED
jgi:hypothetical protein